jgi:hypothetical protein
VWIILNCSLVTKKNCKFSNVNAVTDKIVVFFWVSAPYSGYIFLCSCYNWLDSVKPLYITDTFVYPYHVSIHFNRFIYPEDAGSTFSHNMLTFNQYTVQKPK